MLSYLYFLSLTIHYLILIIYHFIINLFYRTEKLFLTITTAFDRVLNPHLMIGVNELPKAIVLDLSNVRLIDLTGKNIHVYAY